MCHRNSFCGRNDKALAHRLCSTKHANIFLVVFGGTIIGIVLNNMVEVHKKLQIVWKKIIIQSQKVSLRTVGVPYKLQMRQILSTNQKHLNFSPVV